MRKILACLGLLTLCACDNSRYAYDDAYWGNGAYNDYGYDNRNKHWDDNYEHHDGYHDGRDGNRGGREGSAGRSGGGGHGGSGHR